MRPLHRGSQILHTEDLSFVCWAGFVFHLLQMFRLKHENCSVAKSMKTKPWANLPWRWLFLSLRAQEMKAREPNIPTENGTDSLGYRSTIHGELCSKGWESHQRRPSHL